MEKEFICIVCPKGCALKVTAASEPEVNSSAVTGNQCKRGAAYAVNEWLNPVRMLTTTVRLTGSGQPLAPVKSSSPLPKAMLFECMAAVNACTAKAPLGVGDIIIKNILGTGIDIISTSNCSGAGR
jgi:CxxC motif-containing protein